MDEDILNLSKNTPALAGVLLCSAECLEYLLFRFRTT